MDIEVRKNFNAKNLTSFKVSGLVKNAYFPKNIDELVYLLKNIEKPLILGNCSNILLSSEGYDGDIIFTTKCKNIIFDNRKVYCDCGVKGQMASKLACENCLSGFEFMIGFPGSIGGEIYMNASAQGQAISDYLTFATVFDFKNKETKKLSKADLKFDYRHSICQDENYVVLNAEFELTQEKLEIIKEKMDFNLQFRRNHQPSLALPNCGSVFKNPENNSAGKLLDSVGAKQLSYGGAKVWENHANFIINSNDATSFDILNLMLLMYNKVKEKYDIKLAPEVIYIGNKSHKEEEIWKILKQK
ncbi:UDP-N-acetylmuramate dehydrogenase [bacterium]|nr:UDP-N-acetylmuramate dehydrogenase [bacterium]